MLNKSALVGKRILTF